MRQGLRSRPLSAGVLVLFLLALQPAASAAPPSPTVDDLLTYVAIRVWGTAARGSLLDADAQRPWMSEGVSVPSALQHNGRVRLYFGGLEATDNPSVSRVRIGLAESDDGLSFQLANGGEPVFGEGPAGAFDSHSVSHPMVLPVTRVQDGEPVSEFWMYYAGADGTQGSDLARVERLGLARSTDGVTWQRQATPVMDVGAPGEIDSTQIASPFVLQQDGGFLLWYGAYDGKHRIAFATSSDGISWIRHGAVQGLRGADAGELGPSVYFDGSRYLMFYSSLDAGQWKLYGATSDDGLNWAPAYGGQPVVTDAPEWSFARAGEGRNSAVHPTRLLPSGSGLLGYYTGEDENSVQRIGALSIAPTCTFALDAAAASVRSATDLAMVTVTTQAGCFWNATSESAFLTVGSTASRSGPAAVSVVVAANRSSAARTGSVTIAGLTFAVTQAGAEADPDRRARENARADFDGDGRSDLLWQDDLYGYLAVWTLDGHAIRHVRALSHFVPNPEWRIAGTGDFNGDGKPDIVWHHRSEGWLYLWYMDGVTLIGETFLSEPRVADTGWKVVAVGDFDGDRKPDLVWRHATAGWLAVWLMDGRTVRAARELTPNRIADPAWEVAGLGDFNGDGQNDLIWRHRDAGYVLAWLMNGLTQVTDVWVRPSVIADPDWRIAAVIDADGDNQPDLVWHHAATGLAILWYMDGVTQSRDPSFAETVSINWKIVGPK